MLWDLFLAILFWTLWWERNITVFEDVTPFVHRMKAIFCVFLWSWANLYSVDNTYYLVDFFDLVGV